MRFMRTRPGTRSPSRPEWSALFTSAPNAARNGMGRFAVPCAVGAQRESNDELGLDRVGPWRQSGNHNPSPLALLVGAQALSAVQDPAAPVEPLGVEGRLDL